MAGTSGKFVGGIPEEVWNSMSQEERDRQVHGNEDDKFKVGLGAGAVGAGAGVLAGTTLGGLVGGGIGGFVGGETAARYARGKLAERTPPSPMSREEMRREFEAAKYRD